MFLNQIRGLIAIILFFAVIPLISLFQNYFPNYKTPDYANQYKKSITIEIMNKETGNGIYFIESGSTASQLLSNVGFNVSLKKDFELANGMKLIINSNSNSLNKISVSSIDNSSRLALGMPIDLNQATDEDLILIPGIGEKTAQKIINLRNKKISFRKIEELKEIKGIKEKKLAKLRQYFVLQ
ncbi:MAG: helix-hairpin-helix domain-containing protein [Smithella sp.]